MAITIKDIAQQLKISPATVSLALNGRPGVNAQTRANVLEVVKELNYTGNVRAEKSPKRRQGKNPRTIGFLVYKRYGKIITDSQFFTALISAVERAAKEQNCTILLVYCIGEKEISESLRLLKNSNLIGLLVLGTELSEEDAATFYHSNLPTVILDCDILGCELDTVTIHNKDGIFRGMKYFHELGHKEIGYLRSSFSIRNFAQRFFGYERCLEFFGMDRNEQKIFMLEPTIEGACADVLELIKVGIKFPPAIIADNDLIALGAIKAFSQCGIRVPEDVSIIGFDDIPLASFIEPQLTSIHVSCDALGETAVEQLLNRQDNPNAVAKKISVGTELKIRSSVIPKTDLNFK